MADQKTILTDQPPAAESVVNAQRVYLQKLTLFNALRDLTPAALATQIQSFGAGYLRQFSLTLQAIEEGDDLTACVTAKRKGAIKRRSYEVMMDETAPEAEAQAHKEVLEYFWSNVEVTNAVDMNVIGGWRTLTEQMLDSTSKRYAVHEIIWKPTPEGLTARFNFVPLWFFENRSGKLRFLPFDFAYDGTDLEKLAPGGWMVTVGTGIGTATARAFMWKIIALKNWLIYTEKHGMPGIIGKSSGGAGSAQWEAMKVAVGDVASDFSAVIGLEEEIDSIEFGAQGELPYPALIERMDRGIASLLRGADLSTISADTAGASLQNDEAMIIEQDDGTLISDTLNQQIERKVIAYHFGEGTKPLAYIRIVIPEKKDVQSDILIDTFLRDSGVKLSSRNRAEYYGRQVAEEGEDILEAPAVSQPAGGIDESNPTNRPGGRAPAGGLFQRNTANERPRHHGAREALATAFAEDLANLRERLEAVMEIQDLKIRNAKLMAIQADLKGVLRDINRDPGAAHILEQAMTSAFFGGMDNQPSTFPNSREKAPCQCPNDRQTTLTV